jgi:phosphatidylserine/phosphatidylglycerophosphate/cardiolipin synthase-like enzyme
MVQGKIRLHAFGWLATSALAVSGIALAQDAPTSSIELVQSYPIETTLQVSGVAQTQQVWLDLVNSATQTLDVEQYYVNNEAGQSLDPIITAIKAAAARGVQVRFIIDSAFLTSNPTEVDCLSNVPGIDIREIDFSPGIMHAKYMVADGVNAYTGSANMDWLALSHIHEMGLHTVDAQTGATLESIFNTDWPNATEVTGSSPNASSAPALLSSWGITGLPGITVVASPQAANPAGVGDTLDAITALMNAAQSSLDIQVYQYTTSPYSGNGPSWTALDSVVRATASRGIPVRIMVDATVMSKKSKAQLQELAALPNIQVKAITIPEWSGGPLKYARLIHSKYFVIDGGATAWIGSENWIDSYFLNTRNVGMTIENNSDLGAQVEQVYNSVWDSGYGAAISD